MQNDNSHGSCASVTRGFAALFAVMLVMGLGGMAPPAEAAPFAYVVNSGDGTVSVIDTGHQQGGGHDPALAVQWPRCGSRHPGWETRLCRE